MGFDHIDVIYANVPPDTMPLEQMVHDVVGLISSGRAHAWAVVNWPADQLLELSDIATRDGLPQPCCVQLPYSLVHRSRVEDDGMSVALAACGAPVVASYVLAGGVFSGKYDADPSTGRAAGSLDQPMYARGGRRPLARRVARRLDATPATLTITFALENPAVATVLFGATSPAQVEQNVAALEPTLVSRRKPAKLSAIGAMRLTTRDGSRGSGANP